MITPANAMWCALVMTALLTAWGVIWWLGRARPTDWTAPARDLNEVDAAYAEARAMQTEGPR